MPGSSLWLLPPSNSPLNSPLTTLVALVSSRQGSPHKFLPHVTLTSEISPSIYSSDPQAWLDSLDLSAGKELRVRFKMLASEDVFVRKCYIQCEKTDSLKKLAGDCRRKVEGFEDERKAEKWSNEEYNPHLSLVYHDCPPLNAEELVEIGTLARRAWGWTGGTVVLVPTDKPIDQWDPLVSRKL
ncbi:2',3'-cyclic-nucleotide 3'-phosphodiesterase [Phaeosphaeriaceae sp. PMI808]|nr:2',3'-cyclic-nucleotide 3'-phosphodiesterase [Phaeosphaeriaceae sp. PMI808]